MTDKAKPGDEFLGVECPKCGIPILLLRAGKDVQTALSPEAKLKVSCPNATCMRFGKEQTVPAETLRRFRADYLQ